MFLGLYSWGDMDLLIEKDSYVPPVMPGRINEIELLPSKDGDINSSLQGGSKLRRRASFNLYVRDQSQYNTIMNDYENITEKVFKDKFNNNFNAIISSLSIGTFLDMYLFSIELIEVAA